MGRCCPQSLALIGRGLSENSHLALDARVASADAQAPVVAAAQLGVDVAQAVVAGVAAAALELGLAGDKSSRRDDEILRLDLKKRASAATDLPDRFMKVCGCSSQTLWPAMLVRAIRPWWRARHQSASARAPVHLSTKSRRLWRVVAFRPGLPRPTNSLIMAAIIWCPQRPTRGGPARVSAACTVGRCARSDYFFTFFGGSSCRCGGPLRPLQAA